jgi:hypothetical protein
VQRLLHPRYAFRNCETQELFDVEDKRVKPRFFAGQPACDGPSPASGLLRHHNRSPAIGRNPWLSPPRTELATVRAPRDQFSSPSWRPTLRQCSANCKSACLGRGGARGIGSCGRPICRSIRSIEAGLKIIDRTVRRPPQGQTRTFSRETRRTNSAHNSRAGYCPSSRRRPWEVRLRRNHRIRSRCDRSVPRQRPDLARGAPPVADRSW